MATYTANRAIHKTLTGTTPDTVNIPSATVEVLNRVGTSPLWVTVNGVAPTASGDDVHVIPSGTWKRIVVSNSTTTNAVVQILGNGNEYSVEEVL